MRITIDAIPTLFRSAGIKNYLYYWIRHLEQQPSGFEIRLFPWLKSLSELDHEASVTRSVSTVARVGAVFLLNRFPAALSQHLGPATDIFHAAKLLTPPRRAKLTATIHDCTCWLVPETQLPMNIAGDKQFAERILARADGLIAVSESTRNDAVRILKLPEKKICVIYHGVSGRFFHTDEMDVQAVRSRLNLNRPYLLFVGTIEPRKNVDTLLDAYQALPPSIRDEFTLVIAGPRGWDRRTLARLASPAPQVRYLGYVPEEDLPGLYAGAAAFVYPSLYEGFGFPVAQAMAAGTPVVTSAVSSLPEITGGAALLVDPHSESDLRNALRRILTSPSLQDELRQSGKIQAQRFSWSRCARESWQFFAQVANGGSTL
jgi:glycosyltransferase involved in cell wall biosynthesis